MNQPAQKILNTYAEYLELERKSDVKHEFLDGEIIAMAGGTLEHARLALRVGAALVAQLGDRPCETFSADARVRVRATGLSTYPDLSVACGRLERDPTDDNALVNPVLLVEVLSESSEGYDRGPKFAHYRRIPSLKEYVLISQDAPRIEVFRRGDNGRWTLFEAGAGETMQLTSIDCELIVDEIYRNALENSA